MKNRKNFSIISVFFIVVVTSLSGYYGGRLHEGSIRAAKTETKHETAIIVAEALKQASQSPYWEGREWGMYDEVDDPSKSKLAQSLIDRDLLFRVACAPVTETLVTKFNDQLFFQDMGVWKEVTDDFGYRDLIIYGPDGTPLRQIRQSMRGLPVHDTKFFADGSRIERQVSRDAEWTIIVRDQNGQQEGSDRTFSWSDDEEYR